MANSNDNNSYYCVACDAQHPGHTCKEYKQLLYNHALALQGEIVSKAPKVERIQYFPISKTLECDIFLSVTVCDENVWINFERDKWAEGISASVHVGILLNRDMFPGETVKIIEEWVQDRKKQANDQKD